MKEQWDRLSRAVGNVFYPILQKILPYINGVLMALTEIFNLLASLLGFEMPEFDYSSLSTTSDAALDLMDNLDGAGESADKLAAKMKGLRSFDKLNVINTPSNAGASVSGGGVGAVDPKIMDAFNKAFEDYDDLMDSVRMKARDIRDSIMEWLGFTKKINPLTGEIEWEYQGIDKTLSNIWDSFMKLNPLAKAFVGYGVWKAFKSMWTWGGKLLNVIGLGGLGKALKNMLEYTQLYTKLANGDLKKGLLSGLDAWKNNATGVERLQVGVVGLTAAIIGSQGLTTAFKSIKDDGANVGNILGGIASGLSSIAGGAMVGASIGGGWGALIGGIASGLYSVVNALIEIGKRRDIWAEFLDSNAERLNAFNKSLKEQYEAIKQTAEFDMTKSTLATKLVDELERITDANGKVKQGYEDRASFIVNELNKAYDLEIKMVDGVIQGYGEQLKSIKEIIKKQKDKIYLQMAEEKYAVAIKNQAKAEDELNKAKSIRLSILQDETLSEEERIEKLKLANEQVKTAEENIRLNQEAVANYEGLTTAIVNNNAQAIEEYEKKVANTYHNIEGNVRDYYVSAASNAASYWEQNLKVVDKSYDELDEKTRIFVDEQLNDFTTMFKNGVQQAGEITPEMVAAWQRMATESEGAFLVAFNSLPDDLKQQLAAKMPSVGAEIVNKAQQGINQQGALSLTAKIDNIQIPNSAKNQLKTSIGAALGLPFFQANGGIFVNGKWQDIAQYATGTANAPVGQMFVARERGPELVGTIGGHTAVMNNDQIVSSVASGVYQAVRSATSQQTISQPQIFNIYLDKDNKIATYMLDKFDDMAKSNGKPIEIGG